MSDVVLDASALLALFYNEPGADVVRARVRGGASIGAVNLAEVLTKLQEQGLSEAEARREFVFVRVAVVDYDQELAYLTAGLRERTRQLGLSLGDRACLALALREGATAVTAERRWGDLDLGVAVEVIR